jgi:HK97 gp10 family phage protein
VRVDKRTSDPGALHEIANSQPVQDQAQATARAIRRDARRLAPRRTGNLARHIQVEEIIDQRTGIHSYAVGWDDEAFYGPFVEEGGEGRRPRPHLVPAAIKNGATGSGGDR